MNKVDFLNSTKRIIFAEECIEWVIFELEGGDRYVELPGDPGGATKYGIAARFHPTEDIRNLTLDRAKDIYYNEYWTPAGLSLLQSVDVAKRVLGFAVHLGWKRAIKVLQRSLRATGDRVKEDGVLGPQTANAVNKIDPSIFVPMWRAEMAGWYRTNQKDDRYLEGYLNRAYK